MKSTLPTLAFAILATSVAAQGQFNAAAFPPLNAVPPIDSPEMKEWLKGLNFDDVPKWTPHKGNPPTCAANSPILPERCWWPCQGCANTDHENCPNPGDWGITFDDGPTPQTIPLLATLKEHKIKATFFVMGTNVVQNPDILKKEVEDGHHIASHTWSHHALTTLKNEEIVAEIKWAEKAVQDITGHQMKYVRPPYGDIDDRVRVVLKKLGYTVVDWTSDDYDSKDFGLNNPLAADTVVTAAVTKMATTLNAYAANPALNKNKGVITLQHDLYNVTINFAQQLLKQVTAVGEGKLRPMSVADCLGDKAPYQNSPPPSAQPSSGAGGNGTTGGNGSKGGKGSSASGLSVSSGMMMAALALVGTAFAAL